LCALRVLCDEVVDLDAVHTPHAAEQARRVVLEAGASNVLGDESEVCLSLVLARDVREDGSRVQRHPRRDRIFGVVEAVVVGADGSGTLAPDNDTIGVAAERCDVVPGPHHGSSLVEQTKILVLKSWSVGTAEDVETVVESHYDVVLCALYPLSWDLDGHIHASGRYNVLAHVTWETEEAKNLLKAPP
jgi:hypothetical protein